MLAAWCICIARGTTKVEIPVWGDSIVDAPYQPVVTVYLPAEPNGAMVMMCPGGGYSGIAINHEGHDLADWMTAQGYGYAVLRYRLPQDCQPLPQADASQALRLLRQNAPQWGIDPARIGIMGCSAGGHLASSVAAIADDAASRPAFQILLYPVITMDDAVTHRGTRNNLIGQQPTAEAVEYWSTDKRVDASTPPAFIAVSADDDLVPLQNSLLYTQALADNGVEVELHVYPSGGHGWGWRDSFKYKPQWTATLRDWLARR